MPLRFICSFLALCAVIGAVAQPGLAQASTPSSPATSFFASTGYSISDPVIWTYFQRHGGERSLGAPISNAFRLQGNKVQLFRRVAVGVHPDGSVGTLDLVNGYVPVASIGGLVLAPDADLAAQLRALTPVNASAYLDNVAPNAWNGMQANFAATYRSSVRCEDVVGAAACDGYVAFGLANDLWGLPMGHPAADPHSPDLIYLGFQRTVMVYSRAAGQTQFLLLGELFKQVLQGTQLPAELTTAIISSPQYARYYAQYDPRSANSLARPGDLQDTTLAGAFQAPAGDASATPQSQVAGVVQAPAPLLDQHFGVAEGFRAPGVMAAVGAGWERVVIPWDQVQPTGPADFSHLGQTLPEDTLNGELARGVHVAAVLQFTPAWAQGDSSAGQRSAPRNLYLPYDDPNNYWGRFVYQTVLHYSGRINEWLIWNEPDIRLSDTGVGGAWTWAGSDEDFAQLLKVAYLAAKQANPAAVVAFPATTYWADELSNPRRPPFYDRVMAILRRDPQSPANAAYHDAVALNLYQNVDDVYRVHDVITSVEGKYGLDKPVWLTEANAAPGNDPLSPCSALATGVGSRTSLDEQASYAVQTFALASAAGYAHTELYNMVDPKTCGEPDWGMLRSDGTQRPIVDAAREAVTYFSNFVNARFAPLARDQERWPAWPANAGSYVPNWRVYQVAFDRPSNQRVTALWNGDGSAVRVRIPKNGSSAQLVSVHGTRALTDDGSGGWIVDLPGATARVQDKQNRDPDGYYYIGGEPQLVVEDGVDPATSVVPPQLIHA